MASRFLTPFGGRGAGSRDPFLSLQNEMNRLVEDTFRSMDAGEGGQGSGKRFLAPRLDVHESEKEYCVTVDLPGVAESDLDLSLEGDLLTIRGEKKQERERDERGYHIMERSSGAFQRSLRLPFEPDPERVTADCRDGVLTIHVPKEGQQQRTRKIAVNRGEGGQGSKPGGRTIEGRSGAANDRQQEHLQQAASQQGTRQAGGSDDMSRGQGEGQEAQGQQAQGAQAGSRQADAQQSGGDQQAGERRQGDVTSSGRS